MDDPVRWPGVPRLLGDLRQVRESAEDTAKVDADAARRLADGIGARAPVASGYLAGSVGSAGADVTIRAGYWTYVEAGTWKMAAHPFVGVGIGASLDAVEGLYADHLEAAFDHVTGNHY